ncbi:hypothetical protein [Nocardia carnea]|uniref:hypothetical protein n=1 Tax=Nocardia carnea TaxID=37328 RepID=UPI002458AA1B|nr:hypothetical protein [Nocardia carnea]
MVTARPPASGSTDALHAGRPQRAAAIAAAPAPTALDPLAGTASTQLVRLVRDAACGREQPSTG